VLAAVLLAAAALQAGCYRNADDPAAPQASASEAAVAATLPTDAEPPQANPKFSFGHQAGLHRTRDGLGLTASAAIAIDRQAGTVLFAKNEEAVLPIASLTKMMTALVLMDAKLPMDAEIQVTAEDVDTERNSRSRLRVGTVLTRSEALHLALMSSENRAAHALGRTYPGGISAFVDAMNRKAKQLGMAQSTFVDPTGLSNRNQSSVRDLATLASAAARHELLRDYSTTRERQVTLGGRNLRYLNSNRLVKNPKWDIALQKTGYIVEAGQCVAMVTRVEGRDVVMVLLDAGSKRDRSGDAERLRKAIAAQLDPPAHLAGAAAPGKT
jgi:D-alanyl-D-alanine endopeptidase (penicillin-binding protein 7)